jgi:chromosome partitioning protein
MEGGSAANPGPAGRPYVIVVGNEKGGTGKSTTAVHLAVALLRQGYGVATLDLDPRQRTLTRYIENRQRFADTLARPLPAPRHATTDPLEGGDAAAQVVARARVAAAIRSAGGSDFLIIDTPGSASALARAGHEAADTLITPINDSFIDIDVLAQIDRDRRTVIGPSVYTQMVWECHNRRVVETRPAMDWIVMRNRLAHIDSRNMRDITALMDALARRIGFRLAPGFGERVVFRELFPLGLTVLDLPERIDRPGADTALSGSHRAARDELGTLLATIGVTQPVAA